MAGRPPTPAALEIVGDGRRTEKGKELFKDSCEVTKCLLRWPRKLGFPAY